MPSTRYIKSIPGRDSTGDTIYFSFEAGVTSAQAGTYYIRYQVGDKAKVIVDSQFQDRYIHLNRS